MKAVRWLGAFGKAGSLGESLNWELTQTERRELAAERIFYDPYNNCWWSGIAHTRVGLLVKTVAVVKTFHGDCWSVPFEGDGVYLRKTRNPRSSSEHHEECWIRPQYVAIVVVGWKSLAESTRHTVAECACKYGLPVVELHSLRRIAGLK